MTNRGLLIRGPLLQLPSATNERPKGILLLILNCTREYRKDPIFVSLGQTSGFYTDGTFIRLCTPLDLDRWSISDATRDTLARTRLQQSSLYIRDDVTLASTYRHVEKEGL